MNLALADVFLANLPKAICKTYEPIRMKDPNTVFLYMFDWFINNYGKTTTKDRKANQQQMAAKWHPAEGFERILCKCRAIPHVELQRHRHWPACHQALWNVLQGVQKLDRVGERVPTDC